MSNTSYTTTYTTTIKYQGRELHEFTLSWSQGTDPIVEDVLRLFKGSGTTPHQTHSLLETDPPFRQTCRLFDILDARPLLTPIFTQLRLETDQKGDRLEIDCLSSDWRQTQLALLPNKCYCLSISSTSQSELRRLFIRDLEQAFQKQISDTRDFLSVTKMPNEFVQKYQTGFGWYHCLSGRDAPMPYMSGCYQMMNHNIAYEWRRETGEGSTSSQC